MTNQEHYSGRRWLIDGKVLLVIALTFFFLFQLHNQAFAQGTSRRFFTLFGDLRVDESEADNDQKALTFDVILYSRGNQVLGRQRVSSSGRYRFMNLSAGDYYLAVELENVEVARLVILITGQYADDIQQNVNLEWRSISPRSGEKATVVSAVEAYPRSPHHRSLFDKSAHEIERKDYPAAIVNLKSIVADDPKDFPAWFDLGMVYFIQSDLENAEKSFAGALSANPTYYPALLSLGRVRLARKNYEGAIATFDNALKINPTSPVANYFLGESYLQLKKGSIAVRYLNEALRLDPVKMADAHLRLATLYHAAGYKDKAASQYQEFLKKKPNYPDRKKLEEYIQTNKSKANVALP